MSQLQLSKQTRLVKIADAAISAGTAVQSSVVDMANYEGVVFFGSIATANAGNFASVQTGDASNAVTTDLAGTKNVTAANGDVFMIDVTRPRNRFLRVTVTRAGANTATGDIYALLYGPRNQPTSQPSTTSLEAHVSPAPGTA